MRGAAAFRPATKHGTPLIASRGVLVVGANVAVRSIPVRTFIEVAAGAALVLGDRIRIGHGVSIQAYRDIAIGDDVLIGPFAIIMDTDHHHPGDRHAPAACAPIVIEAGARIGAHATILRGADVGAGAWVEPGSVVIGHVPPGATVSGNPAFARTTASGRPSRSAVDRGRWGRSTCPERREA